MSQFLQNRIVNFENKQVLITVGGLGEGELEAMALYWQLGADQLLLDDRRARRVAEANQINCIETSGMLLLAKHHGLVTKITPFIERLRQSPVHYADALLDRVLQLAEE